MGSEPTLGEQALSARSVLGPCWPPELRRRRDTASAVAELTVWGREECGRRSRQHTGLQHVRV